MSAQGSLTRLATQCQGNMPSPSESEGSEEAEGASPEERETGDTKRSAEKKQVTAREKYHHEEHEGHKVKSS